METTTINLNGELREGTHFDLFLRDGENTPHPRAEVERVLMPYKGKNIRVKITVEVEEVK